jgi:hypothetical protein
MKLPAQIYDATDNPDGGTYLRTAYDPDFLNEFKAAVPFDHRSWNADDREWWVSDQYAKRAIRIAADYFNLEYCDD